jgi:transcription-repair coupling factor (superfamily II helicase)
MSLHARATRPFRGKEHLSRVSRSAPRQHATANVLPASLGLLAIRLLDWAAEAGGGGLIYVAATNRRAERLASILRGLAPELEVLLFPPWDCLPYDRSSPSREAMGRRMATLRRVCHPRRARVLLTVPDALIQRVAPRSAVTEAGLLLQVGDALDVQVLNGELQRLGYLADARVDEPGEFALLGQVLDVFPPGSGSPIRIEYADGRIQALRCYHPEDQLTFAEVEKLQLDPASEIIAPRSAEPFDRKPGVEHRLPEFYAELETLFDYLPTASIRVEPAAERRRTEALEQIADAYATRLELKERRGAADLKDPLPPQALFIPEQQWIALLADKRVLALRESHDGDEADAVPLFAAEANPMQAFGSFLKRAGAAL